MEKISAIHPELHNIARTLPRFSFSRENLWLWRCANPLLRLLQAPKDIHIENIRIPSQEAGRLIRLRIYRSRDGNAPAPALLWMHGGGYIIGTAEQDDPGCIHYVRQLGLVVVSVDYRLAPEHPFPAPLEDCYQALIWMGAHAAELGIDANRIAIGGSSAGAGLAAALAHMAHDRQEIKPAFQLLVYPMLDDRTCTRTDLTKQERLVWTLDSNCFGWQAYLREHYGTALIPVHAVPARRANLTGLPPAWIGVGTLDLFYDEDVAYAQRLLDCGVPCELVVVPGAFHGFDVAGTKYQVVQEFRESQIAALKKCLLPANTG
ncbi:MAG TPA: alpha/beta hydrolase [Anaerolineales bacterium]|nr:alpha/beta hydrolase [Anaerolineales bacterium]